MQSISLTLITSTVNTMRSCPELPSDRHEILLGGLRQIHQVIARIHLLRLDHTEFACLKALVLFKPGIAYFLYSSWLCRIPSIELMDRFNLETRGLRDGLAVEMLQDQTQIMLHEYCSSSSTVPNHEISAMHGHHGPSPAGRFGKLLLILPALKAVQSASVVDLFFRKLIGDTPISRLLADLTITTGTL